MTETLAFLVLALGLLVGVVTFAYGPVIPLGVLLFVGILALGGATFAGVGWLNRSKSSTEIRELQAALGIKDSQIERLQQQLGDAAQTIARLSQAVSHSASAVQRNTQANLTSLKLDDMLADRKGNLSDDYSADDYFSQYLGQ